MSAALAAVFALSATASAATVDTHPYLESLTPPASATPKGPFKPGSVAVHQGTGNLYVVDRENDVIDIFKPNGAFLGVIDGSSTPWGGFNFTSGVSYPTPIAVDNSGGPTDGRIYVKESNEFTIVPPNGPKEAQKPIVALSPSGSYLFSNSYFPLNVVSLDVESDGALVVALNDYVQGRSIGVFPNPESTHPADEILAGTGIGSIGLQVVALDSDDNLYAVGYYYGQLGAVNRDDSLRWRAATSGEDIAVDVDRSSDEVYAVEGVKNPLTVGGKHVDVGVGNSYLSRYDTDGNHQESFGLSLLSQGNSQGIPTHDIAVGEASGRIYVTDRPKGEIHVFGPRSTVTAPDASAEAATSVTETTATLNGTVNPQGVPASWRFQYRRQKTRLWTSLALGSAGSDTSDVPVSSEVTDLAQNTSYEVRLQAVNSDNGAINTSNVITFTTPGQQQAILTIDPASSLTPTSAHLAGTVDPNGTDAKWHFEYATDNSFEEDWTKAGAEQTVSAGSGATAVSADISGLRPNTHYFARLIGTNETGGPKASDEIEFTTPPAPPVVRPLAAGCLKQTSACLAGYVDAKNSATTYYFEYGTDEDYGTSMPASQDGDAGSAFGPRKVAEQLTGLQPNTTYHFRLVAHNAAGTTHGDDVSFKTRPDAAQLATMEADWPTRGYELVNTPGKGNQAVYPPSKWEPWTSVSADGNRVMWMTANGGPDTSTGTNGVFLADYTPTGWSSRNVLPDASQLPGEGDAWFSLPLGFTPDLSHSIYLSAKGIVYPHFEKTLIGVDDARHATALATFPATKDPKALYDASRVAEGGRVVVGGGSAGYGGPYPLTLYEPDGSAESVPVPACGYEQIISETGTGDVLVAPGAVKTWVSEDASRIFVHSAGEGGCDAPQAIFMLEPETGAITRVSGAQSAPASFLRASAEGTELLYSKDGDVYRWSESGGEECLSCGSGYEISTDVTVSPDLSHAYFCGPIPAGSPPQVDCAIHVWSQEGVDFVANRSEIRPFNGGSNRTPLQTSEDGRRLLFHSTRSFVSSADDTGWSGIESAASAVATQVYLYDEESGIVECVSCADPPSGGLPGPEFVLVSNRLTLSADGGTVVFSTNAKLVPEDINGRFDVYEWHEGLIRLITDGESEFQKSLPGIPRVWGLSPDGRSLFFSAGGVAITGNELDTVGNVYAARVGSAGFPPQQPPAHCVEDSCQGPLAPAPTPPGTASATFAGPGNESQAKVRKKKAKKQKKAKKRRQARKRRQAQKQKKAKKRQARRAKANHKRGGAK